MSKSDNLAIVKKFYQVIEEGDYTLLPPLFSDDIHWYGLTLDQRLEAKVLQGIQPIIKFFEASDQVLESHWIPETILPEGDRLVVIGKGQHTSKITQYCFENHWVHILTLHQGKITEFRTYIDAVTILAVSN